MSDPLSSSSPFFSNKYLQSDPQISRLIGADSSLSELAFGTPDIDDISFELQSLVFNFKDVEHLPNISKGKAMPALDLLSEGDLPNWTERTKSGIKSSYEKGLKNHNTTPEELTHILNTLKISSMEITPENITNPAYKAEVEDIQEEINRRLMGPDAMKYGIAQKMGVDGQFGKTTIKYLLALKDTERGDPVSIDVESIAQRSRVGCYKTCEAMLFNILHGKEGTEDAYGEFDTRDRISRKDRNKSTHSVGVSSESNSGRITVNREKSLKVLNLIDSELDMGQPALVGVSHSNQTYLGKEPYNEGITDHFVLITGRDYDEQGVFYTFNDTAGGKIGKLRMDPITGKLSGSGSMAGIYDVTNVSIYEPKNVESYQRLGKEMISYGVRNSDARSMQLKLTAMGFDTNGTTGAFGNGTLGAVKEYQQHYNDGKPEDRRINEMGTVDTHTLRAIDEEFTVFQQNHPNRVMFENGANNALVSDLQKKLSALNNLLPDLNLNTKGTNGSFGNGTKGAIEQFQQAYLNPPVPTENFGKIDNRTWLKILEVAASHGIN